MTLLGALSSSFPSLTPTLLSSSVSAVVPEGVDHDPDCEASNRGSAGCGALQAWHHALPIANVAARRREGACMSVGFAGRMPTREVTFTLARGLLTGRV